MRGAEVLILGSILLLLACDDETGGSGGDGGSNTGGTSAAGGAGAGDSYSNSCGDQAATCSSYGTFAADCSVSSASEAEADCNAQIDYNSGNPTCANAVQDNFCCIAELPNCDGITADPNPCQSTVDAVNAACF